MQALPKEYELSVCEIKSMDNDLLLTGFISEINDEYVQISSYKEERLPLLRFDLPVKISVHNPKLGLRVAAGSVYISSDEIMRLVHVESLHDFERRAFYRVPTSLRANLLPIPDPDDTVDDGDELPEIPIVVQNLSLTGMLFCPVEEKTFFIGDRYVVEMDLGPGVGKLAFNVRVCRYEQYPGKPQRYGCEFYGYTQKQSDRLCSYIFKMEQEMIRRKKNKQLQQA